MPDSRNRSAPLKFARGWLLATETSAGQAWVLWLGALIRARVVRLDETRYTASVESLIGYPQAEFGSLLEAQRWCGEEIGWLLLETKTSLKFNRTRAVCSRLFERSYL